MQDANAMSTLENAFPGRLCACLGLTFIQALTYCFPFTWNLRICSPSLSSGAHSEQNATGTRKCKLAALRVLDKIPLCCTWSKSGEFANRAKIYTAQ